MRGKDRAASSRPPRGGQTLSPTLPLYGEGEVTPNAQVTLATVPDASASGKNTNTKNTKPKNLQTQKPKNLQTKKLKN